MSERAPAPGAADVSTETEVLRRRWPEVLETLKQIKRVTWILVDQNAQVADLDATTLRLAFSGPGLAAAFRHGPHGVAVQQAVRETLGFDVRVEGVFAEQGTSAAPPLRVTPSTSSNDGMTAAASAAPPRSQSGAIDALPPDAVVASGSDEVPDAEDPGEPEWRDIDPADASAAAHRGPVAAARPTSQPRSAPSSHSDATPRSSTTAAPTPKSTVVSHPASAREAGELAYARAEAARTSGAAGVVEDSPSPDDPDLVTSGLSGAPLVAQMLGGTVIDEQLGDEV